MYKAIFDKVKFYLLFHLLRWLPLLLKKSVLHIFNGTISHAWYKEINYSNNVFKYVNLSLWGQVWSWISIWKWIWKEKRIWHFPLYILDCMIKSLKTKAWVPMIKKILLQTMQVSNTMMADWLRKGIKYRYISIWLFLHSFSLVCLLDFLPFLCLRNVE